MKNLILLIVTFASLSALGQNRKADLDKMFKPYVDAGILGTTKNLPNWTHQSAIDNLLFIDAQVLLTLNINGIRSMDEARRSPEKMDLVVKAAIAAIAESTANGDRAAALVTFDFLVKNCLEFKTFDAAGFDSAQDALK